MTTRKLFALLCGINDYTPNVGSLHGCLNDVDHYESWLTERFPADRRSIEVLKDSQATRGGIIDGFRQHLAQATAEDIVLFQFAGHGARWKSAPEFLSYYPDGFDEGLVCWDSRRDPTALGSFDLADKELAVLVAEVASRCQHVTILLDCCHSGSGTRSADDLAQMAIRLTHQVDTPRPLESYLNGHYSRLKDLKKGLETVSSRHILLAACERKKQAFEGYDRRGIFSSTLLENLDRCGGLTTYADLFLRVRATVQQKAYNQTPQFEVFRGFDGHQGFLGAVVDRATRPRYLVRHNKAEDHWTVDFGAIQGFSPVQHKPLEFAVFTAPALGERLATDNVAPTEEGKKILGSATATNVGLTRSRIELNFVPPAGQQLLAEVTSLPASPLLVAVKGDEAAVALLQAEAKSASVNTIQLLTDGDRLQGYVVEAINDPTHGNIFSITDRTAGKFIQGVRGHDELAARHVIRTLTHIADWEARLALQNYQSRVNPEVVPLNFVEHSGTQATTHDGSRIRLVIDGDRSIRGKLVTQNTTGQQLYSLLVHFSDDFGMTLLDNDEFPNSPHQRTILLDGSPDLELFLDESGPAVATERFMLIVSSQPIDEFLIGGDRASEDANTILQPLPSGIVDPVRDRKIRTGQNKLDQIDWFTRTLEIELVRRGNQTGAEGLQLENAPIFIKAHPEFQAEVQLLPANALGRSIGPNNDIWRPLCNSNFSLMNFTSSRGDNSSVLELTGITKAASLATQPLEIEIAEPLQEGESIVALTYDGEHLLIAGQTTQIAPDRTLISISEIPEMVGEKARSIVSTLKLYFFKTYLKLSNVNQLRSVDFREDGSVSLDRYALADRLSKANRVVLLVHGFCGDGATMAREIHPKLNSPMSNLLDGGAPGTLVLTWDYEHLSSTLQSSAKDMQDQLKSIGIGPQDGKQLIVVGHSIGGLVARWLIEQGEGKGYVDELVLLGVPNGGAPLGKIGFATTAAKLLITVAINFVPGISGIASSILSVLLNVSRFTTTLEQLDADGEFLRQLNGSSDPHVQYSILAGDITQLGSSDQRVTHLFAKVGRSKMGELLFDNSAHDLFVSTGSSRNISHARVPQPRCTNLVCHHFSYLQE